MCACQLTQKIVHELFCTTRTRCSSRGGDVSENGFPLMGLEAVEYLVRWEISPWYDGQVLDRPYLQQALRRSPRHLALDDRSLAHIRKLTTRTATPGTIVGTIYAEATRQQNGRNQSLHHTNTTGRVGVGKRRGAYYAKIEVDGRQRHLGTFPTLVAAANARRAAERQYGFAPGHGRRRMRQQGTIMQ